MGHVEKMSKCERLEVKKEEFSVGLNLLSKVILKFSKGAVKNLWPFICLFMGIGVGRQILRIYHIN